MQIKLKSSAETERSFSLRSIICTTVRNGFMAAHIDLMTSLLGKELVDIGWLQIQEFHKKLIDSTL